MAVGRDLPGCPELLVCSVSSCRIIKCQHKCVRETVSLAGSPSTEDTRKSGEMIVDDSETHEEA